MNKPFDLFNPIMENCGKNTSNIFERVKGLTYVPDFISNHHENQLLEHIDNSEWLSDLKRRVQHYGWKYDYRSRKIDYSMYLGKLPFWVDKIADDLFNRQFVSEKPDQVIINEYKPGQGIANHVDCEPCFSDSIVSLSLGSTCIMNLIHLDTKEKIELVLEPRSAIVIQGESRYKWAHGIPPRLADTINGEYIHRKLRLSMTFRKVVL